MVKPRAAYTWDDSARKVTVTVETVTAARVARKVTSQYSPRQSAYQMTRTQFKKFQREFAKVCKHPAGRLYAWTVDDVLYTGCSDCGTVLAPRKLRSE